MRRVSLLSIFLCIAAPTVFAQDAMKVDSKHHTLLFENDQARVLKVRYDPKERSVMHEHAPHVMIFLEDAQVRATLAQGRVRDSGGKAGEVRFNESVTHSVENVGGKPAQVILVEVKPRPPLAARASGFDPVKVDAEHHTVEFEDDRVRVLRMKLKPNETTKEHEHPNGLVVYLTSVDLKHRLAGGKSKNVSGKRGDVAWTPPERHTVENRGGATAEMILIELRR
jgi:quercetin dioxygenase-like cupin family protein